MMEPINRLHHFTDNVRLIAAVLQKFPQDVGLSVHECSDGKIFRLTIEKDFFKVGSFIEDFEDGKIKIWDENYEDILNALKKLSRALLGRVIC
jgi:hypothetical protein